MPNRNLKNKRWYSMVLPFDVVAEDFFATDKLKSTVCEYTLSTDCVLSPTEDVQKFKVSDGVASVTMAVEEGVTYKLVNVDDTVPGFLDHFQKGASEGLFIALLTESATIPLAHVENDFEYRIWNTGKIGFSVPVASASERDGKYVVEIVRQGGSAGTAKATLRLNAAKTTTLADIYEFEDDGREFSWEDGNTDTKTTTITIKNNASVAWKGGIYLKSGSEDIDKTGLSISAGSSSTVTLSYTPTTTGSKTFTLYYLTNDNGSGVVIDGGNYSNPFTVTIQAPQTLATPDYTTFTASNITKTGFTAKWSAVSGATKYNINVKKASETDYNNPSFTRSGITTNSVSVTRLDPGTEYQFQIQAANSTSTSSWSKSSSSTFKTLADLTITNGTYFGTTTLTKGCYYGMFNQCFRLASVTCLATDISASECTMEWLKNAGRDVPAQKTFTTPSTTAWPSGDSGIPDGWTRVDYVAPVVP